MMAKWLESELTRLLDRDKRDPRFVLVIRHSRHIIDLANLISEYVILIPEGFKKQRQMERLV